MAKTFLSLLTDCFELASDEYRIFTILQPTRNVLLVGHILPMHREKHIFRCNQHSQREDTLKVQQCFVNSDRIERINLNVFMPLDHL